ncbi:MAG: hypothetical protein M3P08_18805 [Thermoproteota archaeon]|nr:hypothetical protein [Thermoproteota archaeon]
MSQTSNFTSYKGDLTNPTAIIVWSLKYCNWDSNTHPPTHIAKDGDPKHTVECNKTYDIANNILSNAINGEGKKVDKQFKHCKDISITAEEVRSCMGLN